MSETSTPVAQNGLTDVKLTSGMVSILQWASWGKRNEEIGPILGLTERTVQAYMTKILDLTGTNSRTAAVAFALRKGIIK